jgi:hypothetical protein
VIYPLQNRGDWHVSLDRPADGIFQARDFRLRFELSGKAVRGRRLEDGRFELAAGSHRVVIHPVAGRFDGRPLRWELGGEDGRSFVDCICYQGNQQDFNFRELADVVVAAGVELLSEGLPAAGTFPIVDAGEPGTVRTAWDLETEVEVTASFAP